MSECLLGGCHTRTRVSYILCDDHAVEVWGHVEAVKDTSASPIPPDTVVQKRVIPADSEQWIYFLRLDEKIKIGWTGNYDSRMKAYPPHAVVLVRHHGTRADERDLHRSFKPSRASGREWYHPTPELLAHIDRLKAEQREALMAKQAAWMVAHPPNPRPKAIPAKQPNKPRPLQGQALVRAILDGTVS